MTRFRSNKKSGTDFEYELVDLLAAHGYWAHRIEPDARGAQPFDIVAARDGRAFAIECKTLESNLRSISINRLEENQVLAFARWLACGNDEPVVAVKKNGRIYKVPYLLLKARGNVRLCDEFLWKWEN